MLLDHDSKNMRTRIDEEISFSQEAMDNNLEPEKHYKRRGRKPLLDGNVKDATIKNKQESKEAKETHASNNEDSDDDNSSDKENDDINDKENDVDWNPDENAVPIPKVIPAVKKAGRKPFSELITVMPEERELSEYEKLRLKRIAEQKAMLEEMKKSSKSLSDAILPKSNPRKIVKARSVYIVPTRKNPPVLRSRRLPNNSTESSENGETDSFVYLPAKREYDMYSDSEDEEFRPKV